MQKNQKNKLVKIGLAHFFLAILIGLLLFLVTSSAEVGLLLGLVYWVASWYLVLRKWHTLQWESEAGTDQLHKTNKVSVRVVELVGMIMLGLVLGMFTYFLSHWLLAAALVTFISIAGAIAWHKVNRNKKNSDVDGESEETR